MENLSNIEKLNSFLAKLGLNKNEIKIYLSLNSYGDMNIADINRTSTVPRTSITRNIEKLMQKGLVTSFTKNSEKKYKAETPNKLESIIRDKEIMLESRLSTIKALRNEVDDAIEIFKSERKSGQNEKIEVKYYEGIKGFRDAHDRTLDFAEDEILFFSNHDKWRKVLDVEYDNKYYVPKRVSKGIKNRSLVLKNKLGKELAVTSKNNLREVKFLPSEFNFETTFIIYKGNVSIMIADKPYTAINIKSKEVYKTFVNIFDYIWKQIKG
jgi:sugar-specific transcriptional regulator TrmB